MEQNKIDYLLFLADCNLILSQRSAEWCGHGPVLEQDIAITNITLDLLGQARNFYQYAAALINRSAAKAVTEDTLAYLRTEREFKNLLICELPNGDWAQTILKQYLFSQFQYLLFEQLQNCKDEQIAAIASKSIKETTYHVRWSSEWVIRLGDGTDESRNRMLKAIDTLWMYTGEMFQPVSYELHVAKEGMDADVSTLKEPWLNKVKEIFQEATLSPALLNEGNTFMQTGGKEGRHTEHLGYILTELQYLQRVYPGCEW
ncbi:MAG TPA: phenylacetate-CoA oxygenase subunit PaaC [Ferruginibacter sp.]|nr:phenylacetate-CoA oxygenase subunit PaaC [Ferruginibacter sp.]